MDENNADLGHVMGQPVESLDINKILSDDLNSAGVATNCNELPKKNRKVGRPVKIRSTSELQQKIDAYFADDDNKPFCMSGLAYALNLSRQGLVEYRDKNKEFSDAINKARNKIEISVEQRLLTGGSTGGVIFSLCNNFGWKNPQQHIESKNLNKNENITIHSDLSDEDLDKKLLAFEPKTQAQG